MCSCEQEKLAQLISSQLTVCRKQKNRALISKKPELVSSDLPDSFLPNSLMFAGAAAVIPSRWSNLKQEQWAQTIRFTEKISKKGKVDKECTASFWDTVHTSKAFDDNLRTELMSTVGIKEDIVSVSPAAHVAISSWEPKPSTLFVSAPLKRKATPMETEVTKRSK